MTNTDTADVTATVRQVAALARAGSQLVRVTVNNEEAARAVPEIVEGLDRIGVRVPIIGDFHYNGHLLLTKYPACAAALAKYRINPGNVGGKRRDENFSTIVEIALQNQKPVRIGVNWGSLDQALLTEMMDANAALAEPRDARDVTMDAMVESALRSAALAEATGMRARLDHPERQGLGRAGPGRRLPHAGRSLRLPAPPRPDRGGARHEGDRGQHRRTRDPAAGGHRRHHPSLADARPRRRSHRGSAGGAADPAIAGDPELQPPGHRLPGLRPYHQHLLPADGGGHPELPPGPDAGLADRTSRASRK